MTYPQESNISVYFKIPYTEPTVSALIRNSLTISELLEYVKTTVRSNLNIDSKYDIELVDTGKPLLELASAIIPSNTETLLQRYGSVTSVSFYIRPVDPITRQFVSYIDYSN